MIEMSKIEDRVCAKIQQRAAVGKNKYGVTMERTDLTLFEWLQHLQEELMDAAVYVQRLMEDASATIGTTTPEDRIEEALQPRTRRDMTKEDWEELDRLRSTHPDLSVPKIAIMLGRDKEVVRAMLKLQDARLSMGKDPHPPTNGKKKRWTQDEKDEVKMLFEENILNDAQIAAKMDAPSMVSIAVWRKKWQKGVEW